MQDNTFNSKNKITNIQPTNPTNTGGGGESYLISQVFNFAFFKKCLFGQQDSKDSIESKAVFKDSKEFTESKTDSKILKVSTESKTDSINSKDSIESKNTIFNFAFYAFLIYLLLLTAALGGICFVYGDDWSYSAAYPSFYNPDAFNGAFSGGFWQRGRHIADILMSLSMRPFGEFLVTFGVNVITAYKICVIFFVVLFYFITFISFSLLVWYINGKRDFRIIFTLISLVIVAIFHITDYIMFSAYMGSAGLCMLIFLPVLHYFLYNKEYKFSSDITLNLPMILLLVYLASFQLETSTLLVFGICVFILMYYAAVRMKGIKGQKLSLSMKFYLASFSILIPLSVAMTTFSGRGITQREAIADTSRLDTMVTYLHTFIKNYYNLHINALLIIALVLFFATLLYIIIKRKINKFLYIKFALIGVGVVGMLGFSAIKVPGIYFPCILILCALVAFLLPFRHSKYTLIRLFVNGYLILKIVSLLFLSVINFEKEFERRAPYKDSVTNLIEIYKNAQANNQTEIHLSKEDIRKYNLSFQNIKPGNPKEPDAFVYPNTFISGWMLHYGFTTKYIHLYTEDSTESKIDSKGEK